MFKMLDFRSLRVYAVILHFLATFSLVWTSMDSITVAYDSEKEREDQMMNYQYAIAFSMACLVLARHCALHSINRVTMSSVLHLLMDFAGTIFVLWIFS